MTEPVPTPEPVPPESVPTPEPVPTDAGPAVAEADRATVVWQRLEDQIGWYDRKSQWNQRTYKRLKLLELVIAASIPVMAAFDASVWVPGVAGAVLVVMEGIHHLYKFHDLWISYRATCESLRHERYLYLAAAGPYRHSRRPLALLADRIESLVSQEHARWVATQEQERDDRRDAGTT